MQVLGRDPVVFVADMPNCPVFRLQQIRVRDCGDKRSGFGVHPVQVLGPNPVVFFGDTPSCTGFGVKPVQEGVSA